MYKLILCGMYYIIHDLATPSKEDKILLLSVIKLNYVGSLLCGL